MGSLLDRILAEFANKTIYAVEIQTPNGLSTRIRVREGGISLEADNEPLAVQGETYNESALIFKQGNTRFYVPVPESAKFNPDTFGGGGGDGIPDCLMAHLVIPDGNTLIHIEYL
jgi:hypothetical protein